MFPITISVILPFFLIGCPRVCSIHLYLIKTHFRITLYYIAYSEANLITDDLSFFLPIPYDFAVIISLIQMI